MNDTRIELSMGLSEACLIKDLLEAHLNTIHGSVRFAGTLDMIMHIKAAIEWAERPES